MTELTLTAADAAWLMMESPDTPMHLGVLAVFRKPRQPPEDYISRMAEQFAAGTELAAPWNCRLAGLVKPWLVPRLVPDPKVDLEYHFRRSALPEPGDERELGRIVSRLHSNPLDLTRPLWEFHLIEGLERDRFAFYLKIHHALVRDVNAVPLMLSHLGRSARRRSAPPLWTLPLPAARGSESAFRPGALLCVARNGLGQLRGALGRDTSGGPLLPFAAPRSTLNRRINHQRRFATQQFRTARIAALAEATGSTLNELLAYLCASTLRRFFKEYNALPDESLVGIVPLTSQGGGDAEVGSAIAGIRVPLATHIGDPGKRLAAVKAAMAQVRAERESLPEDAMVSYALLRSVPMFASQAPVIGRLVPPLFNLKVSSSEGPAERLYFAGARLEAVYPMSQLLQYSALSIDCVSYAGTLNIGITGARDTLPHLQRLAVYLGRAVSDLEELVTDGRSAA